MDDLLQKYNDFMRLNNCRAEYLLSNGQTIDFVYKEENFIHLLGLRRWTKGYTIKQPNMDCQPTEITALMRHRAVFS